MKVVPPPKVVKKPDLKGIQAEQAMRFQSLKGTDLKNRPKPNPKYDEGEGKPSLKEGQLLRLGVGGPRREANSDVTRVTPRGGQDTTFDLSKSLAASDLQDLLMSDTVKEGAGGNIREDLGNAKGLGVDFKERGGGLGDSVGRVGGKTLEPNGGAPGSIGKFRKGMGLNRGITDRVGNRRSRVMDYTPIEYTDRDGNVWNIVLVPESDLDADGNWNPEGGRPKGDGAIPVDDGLLDAAQGGSFEAIDKLSMIIQNKIDKHGTKRTSKNPAGEASETRESRSAGEDAIIARSISVGERVDAEVEQETEDEANDAAAGSAGQAATAESRTNDSDDGDDGGSASDDEGATMTFTEEETAGDGDSDDGTDDDDDDDSGSSERGVLGGEQENDKGGGPGNLDGNRFRGIVVGGFSGSGGGDTVRTGEMTGRGGPLAKDPKSGNSGHPTVRTDPDALREGMLNLGKIDDILAGKNGPIDFGEKGDPRGQPKPEGGEGTEGPTIVGGGSPGVVTRKSRAGTLTKLGDIKGEANRGVQTGRVDIKEVEIKEGSQLKAK